MGVVRSFVDLVAPNPLPDILVLDQNSRLMKNYKTVSTVDYDFYFREHLEKPTPVNIYNFLKDKNFFHRDRFFIYNEHKEIIACILKDPQYGDQYPTNLTPSRLIIRDMNRCQYTGRQLTQTTRSQDHIVPRSLGGEDTWENLVLCETDLNSIKSSYDLDEFEAKAKDLGYSFAINANDITERAFEPSIEYLFQNYALMFPRKCRPEWIDMINFDDFEPTVDLKQHIENAHKITPRPPVPPLKPK